MSELFLVFGNHKKGESVKVIVYKPTGGTMRSFGIKLPIETKDVVIRQIAPVSNDFGAMATLNEALVHGDKVNSSVFSLVEES